MLKAGRWTTVAKPEGLSKITASAVGGESAKLMLATDGHTVMRSTDRGCSWKTVYEVATPSVEDTPVDGLLPEVAQLLIPTTSSRVIMVLQGVGKAAGAKVLVSDAAGEEGSFKEATGIPPAGEFRDVIAPADNPDVIYLVTTLQDNAGQVDPAGATGPLYVSLDGGASFTAAETAGGQIEKLAVEPATSGRYLWVVRANGTVQWSQDYGATYIAQTLPPDPGADPNAFPPAGPDHWRDVAVYRFATTKHVVVVTGSPSREADVTRAVISFNKGKTWAELNVDGLGPAGGLFFGASDTQLFSAVPTDNTAYRGPGLLQFNIEEERWQGIDDFELTSLKNPRPVREPDPGQPKYDSIWMRRDKPDPDAPDLLARFEPPPPVRGDLTLKGRPDCGSTKAKKLPEKGVHFAPENIAVKLKPGEPTSVPVKADLVADPTPADVFFLVDHSDSMDPAIDGLFCSLERLVRDLPERNLDIHFGLGAYNGIDGYSYRRLVDVLPPEEAGPQISAWLKKLFTTAGVDEPLRTALFQTATGKGLLNSGRAHDVEPGQQADWRDDKKKVTRYALVITDEPYEEDTRGEPAFSEVTAALNAKNIKVLGLRVQPLANEQISSGDHSPVRQLLLLQQLQNLARDTGTLAPKGGVDCDGGGTPDVTEGQPIVCTINEQGIKKELDDTLVSIFEALQGEDRRAVRLVPRTTSGLNAQIQGGEADLDLRKPARLEGTAVLSCTVDQAGKNFPLTFDLVAGDRVLGSLDGAAQCGDVPAVVAPVKPPKAKTAKQEPQPKPAPKKAPAPAPEPPQAAVPAAQAPAPQPAVAAAPPPPPPAPAPVSSAPAQAPAPASANAAAPQAGMSAQEDRQVASKLATVSTDTGGGDEGVRGHHAMVAVKPRPVLPTEAAMTLGFGITGLFGYVAFAANPRRRRKGAIEPARAGRSEPLEP